MKHLSWFFVAAFSISILAATDETITRTSAPFSFIDAVNVSMKPAVINTAATLTSRNLTGQEGIQLSWKLTAKEKTGTISLFNARGVKIRSFPISSQAGTIALSGNKLPANGIYIASLSYGAYKIDQKLIINR